MITRKRSLSNFKRLHIRKKPSYNNGRFKNNKTTKNHIKFRIFTPKLAIIVLTLWLLYFGYNITDNKLKPTIDQMATTVAHQITTETIYHTLYEEILPTIDYNSIIVIHKDAQNKVSFIQANSVEVGKIVTKAGREIKEVLNALPDSTIEIPLGQVTGISLLANRGPKLPVTIKPMGTVDINVLDKFEEAGINQVKHTIYMEISTQVSIVVPLVSKEEPIMIQIPIAESITVGPVPDTYFGGAIPLQSLGPQNS